MRLFGGSLIERVTGMTHRMHLPLTIGREGESSRTNLGSEIFKSKARKLCFHRAREKTIGREGGSSPTNLVCEICHYPKKAWFSKYFSSLIIAKHDLVCLNDFWTGCFVWQLVFKSKNPPRDVDLCCFLRRWQISHPKFVGDDPPSLPMVHCGLQYQTVCCLQRLCLRLLFFEWLLPEL